MMRTIIYDLDDTLLDTTQLLIPIAGSQEYQKKIEGPLPLIAGASETLTYLKKKYTLLLITQGDVEIQKQKVKSLQIENFFTRIIYVDSKKGESKLNVFSDLNQQGVIHAQQFLSIGNRLSTDIYGAKINGGLTCWFKYGEHQNEKPTRPEEHPDYIVTSHQEIISICHL